MSEDGETSGSAVLVIGGDGLVGRGLAKALTTSGKSVYATTRRTGMPPDRIFLDLAESAIDQIPLPEVSTAVFCAAINGFAPCRENPALAYRVNVTAAEILARRLSARGCRVIYLSSSAVFDFRQPCRRAETRVCPTTVYGETEAAAERCILALNPMATIVRLTKVLTPETSRFVGWLRALSQGERITAYSDLHFSPISLDFVVTALIRIIADKSGGIYQLSGANDLSYAQAARHFARKLGLDERFVIADRAEANGIPAEEIATFTSLEMSRYTALSGQTAPAPLDVLDLLFGPVIEQLGR